MSLPLLHAGRTNPGLSPKLDLRFALDKSLTAYRGPTPSFSRASTGSYFDGSGVLRYASINLQSYSEDFSNAYWTKANSSVLTDQTASPDGKNTADKLVENSSTAFHQIYNTGFSTTSGNPATISVYVKTAGRQFVQFYISSNMGNGYANFDIVNGALGTVSGTGITATITSVGNGWFRISASQSSCTTGTAYFQLGTILTSASTQAQAHLGDGVSGVFIWGAQGELSSTVGTYCPTTSSANSAPRFDHTFNGTSWVSRGLLVEEQRTNSAQYSEDFTNAYWTKAGLSVSGNNANAPDGNLTADKFVETAANSQHTLYNSGFSVTTGTAYIISFFAKAAGRNFIQFPLADVMTGVGSNGRVNFDLSTGTIGQVVGTNLTAEIIDVGNGWYRCVVKLSSAASNGTGYLQFNLVNSATATPGQAYLGDGTSGVLVWGIQLEAGSAFATSYIPSLSNSSTTRSADVCQITGTNFSDLWNAAEGTFACEVVPNGSGVIGNQGIFTANSGTFANVIGQIKNIQNTDGDYGAFVRISNTNVVLFSRPAGSMQAGLLSKAAFGYKQNDFADSLNGAAPLTDFSGTVPAVNQMTIGDFHPNAGTIFNGHIARLRYYRKRLPNATLQQLSEPDPTLNLQFALNKSLTPVAGPAPSFSRASTGSYFDSTGTLRYANVNLITYSERFDNAAWTANGLNAGVSVNLINAPDGTQNADKLFETNVNGGHYLNQTSSITTGNPYTFTIYVKKENRSWIQIAYNSAAFGVNAWANFDVNNGVVGNKGSSATANITSVGSGWYRCSITATSTATATSGPVICLLDTDANSRLPSYLGDGSSGLYIWGAQLELASSPTQYAKTEASTTAGPRFDHVYSGGQWVSRGLLIEEQRTNSLPNSEDFTVWLQGGNGQINSNVANAPDGTTTADEIQVNSGASSAYEIYRAFTYSSVPYSISIFVKYVNNRWVTFGTNSPYHNKCVFFDILNGVVGTAPPNYSGEIVNCGNGWFRLIVKFVGNTGTSNFIDFTLADGDGVNSCTTGAKVLVWGAQIEAGSFSTSYIGTTSSSVVRSADVCQITGTSFNWMWNQGEGSFAVECDRISFPSTTSFAFEAYSDTSNKILLENDSSADYSSVRNLGTDVVAWTISPAIQPNVSNKSALAYKANDFAWSRLGATPVTDTSGGVPYCNALAIGNRGAYGALYALNGHIAKLIYYPARLTNTKLQQLST